MLFATLQLAAVATLLTGAAAAPTPQAPASPINPADVTGNVDMTVGQTLGLVAATEGPLNGRRQLAPASGPFAQALGAVASTYGQAAGPIIPIPGPVGPGKRQAPANPINPADVTGNVDMTVGQTLGAVAAAEGPLNGRMVRRQLAPASPAVAQALGAAAATYGEAAGPIYAAPVA
ncbi:hypothetical protein RQP46_005318 [Phenoliferia psychrophenolica]